MANSSLLTLFLILSIISTTNAAVNFTRPTTSTTINSTMPTTNTNTTATAGAVSSTMPTAAVNSSISTANANTSTTGVKSTIPTTNTTATAVNSTRPTTKPTVTAVNSTRPTYSNNTITPQELDTLLVALRYRGYPLFSNAIDTSDVQLQMLSTVADTSSAFTIFAPKDHFLYTLDMASDADAYVAALLCHVIPSRRLTITQLRNLTSPYLETLLPHYSILVGKSKSDDVFVTVDGVRVSDPDLYLGPKFVVHGLDGILLTGFNMYEDTLSHMGKGFFAPEMGEFVGSQAGRKSAVATPKKASLPAAKIGGFSRIMRKQRRLQYRRIWRSNYSVRRSYDGGRIEDDF
ncbi:PREDICTED: A-agglutinin anchorage subunit-like [Nicotiana attenuata]|uniref:A-agglutinin anchorage subunit-like n=1 Tax=Nicotiana attenuata TaxID=49451 RepID=UPI000904DA84|nr:PREDICTED: A-agglutinin anchorage subunit-like [Nicotiana attenuata]